MKVGISLGDNDFIHTLRAFVEAVVNRGDDFTREELRILWLNTGFAMYLLHQCTYITRTMNDPAAVASLRTHFNTRAVLYVGEEVLTEYNQLIETQNYNGEFAFSLDGRTVHSL